MKLYNLVQVRQILARHSKDTMPVAVAYRIMKFLKNTAADEDFYKENLQKLLETYGAKDENGQYIQAGGGIKIIDDKVDECNKKTSELYDTEVDVAAYQFTIDDFAPLGLTVEELYQLDEMIKEA